ncbi:MAG: ABC transporter permease [Deltaproteobacteria bacterium]|nr:MAG: ABC transporter permease [Deltaproteobacteria bacterium]
MTRLLYFFRRALRGMRQSAFINAVAVVTIGIALFIVAVFAGVIGEVRTLIDTWSGDLAVTVYLSRDAEAAERSAIVERIRRLAGEGARVDLVGREEALARLRASLGEEAEILEGLAENPLPDSIEVRSDRLGASPQRLHSFAASIAELPGVEDVDYGREWAEQLESFLHFLSLVATLIGGLVLFAAAVTVSNTIKLAVFARKEEIEIMKLCGATDAFVRAPFLIEGLLQGVLGALVATGLSVLVWWLGLPEVHRGLREAFAVELPLTPPTTGLLWLLAGGAALGVGGSALSLGRFLKV